MKNLVIGIVIGILPGLSATLGIALMTTLTVKMTPTDAILVLVCVYGYIMFTVYLSFTTSTMMPTYDLAGADSYDRLLGLENWRVSLVNLATFAGLYIGIAGTATALVLQVLHIIDANLLAAYSSNLFGIVCVALVDGSLQWLACDFGNLLHGNRPSHTGVANHRSPKAVRFVLCAEHHVGSFQATWSAMAAPYWLRTMS